MGHSDVAARDGASGPAGGHPAGASWLKDDAFLAGRTRRGSTALAAAIAGGAALGAGTAQVALKVTEMVGPKCRHDAVVVARPDSVLRWAEMTDGETVELPEGAIETFGLQPAPGTNVQLVISDLTGTLTGDASHGQRRHRALASGVHAPDDPRHRGRRPALAGSTRRLWGGLAAIAALAAQALASSCSDGPSRVRSGRPRRSLSGYRLQPPRQRARRPRRGADGGSGDASGRAVRSGVRSASVRHGHSGLLRVGPCCVATPRSGAAAGPNHLRRPACADKVGPLCLQQMRQGVEIVDGQKGTRHG
ncbi:hypothetical protein GCM10023320_22340 [Pseudonocardia adelaidensis]|uniref:Uncharacterized protein n=1 Tax=Pseudonocardia adelaidensis TaxID=648754 RepID=A0ABP9NG03_9PSEU